MELRWMKKYSVCFANQSKPEGARILREEKVLQFKENGVWVDVPTLHDADGYTKAKTALKERGPFRPGPLTDEENDALGQILREED